jgi:hypothetical protein
MLSELKYLENEVSDLEPKPTNVPLPIRQQILAELFTSSFTPHTFSNRMI